MLQRVQSIFLFLAAVFNALLFAFPLWGFEHEALPELAYIYKITVSDALDTSKLQYFQFGAIAIVAILVLLSLAVIFLYKNRSLQMRLVRLCMLLETGLLVVIFFYMDAFKKMPEMGFNMSYKVGIFLPIAAALMYFISNRFIMKDEKLVRSAERFR